MEANSSYRQLLRWNAFFIGTANIQFYYGKAVAECRLRSGSTPPTVSMLSSSAAPVCMKLAFVEVIFDHITSAVGITSTNTGFLLNARCAQTQACPWHFKTEGSPRGATSAWTWPTEGDEDGAILFCFQRQDKNIHVVGWNDSVFGDSWNLFH